MLSRIVKRIVLGLLGFALLLPTPLSAQKGGHSSSRSSTRSASSAKTTSKTRTAKPKSSSVPKKSTVAQRNTNGKITRSAAARNEFMKQTGYPKGRRGYVVDHIVPLECGGADVPSNMQWQTVQAAKMKDRTERNCRR